MRKGQCNPETMTDDCRRVSSCRGSGRTTLDDAVLLLHSAESLDFGRPSSYDLGMPKFLEPALAVLFLILASQTAAQAQGETTSAIAGSVRDPSGAGFPGATVTVINAGNGLKRSVATDASGRFSFPQLMPGTYSVRAEADRFEAQQNNDVSAGLGQKQTVDFKLSIASASQSI